MELTFHFYTAAGVFDHLLNHVEAHARTFHVRVQALEHAKYLSLILLQVDAQAIVAHFQHVRRCPLGVGHHDIR